MVTIKSYWRTENMITKIIGILIICIHTYVYIKNDNATGFFIANVI